MERKMYYSPAGLLNILKLIVPYFVVVGASQMLGFWVAGYEIGSPKTIGQAIIIGFFNLAGHLVILGIFRKYVDGKSFRSLGFQGHIPARDLFVGLFIGFEVMFLGFMSLILTDQLDFLIFQYSLTDLLTCSILYIIVAITEELLMRGYVLNNLMASFDKYPALIISALLFSLTHGFNPGFTLLGGINLFLAGILLGLSYIFTRNLWFPIALHFGWNFFQGPVFGFNVSGNSYYSLLLTQYGKATVWNGGAFGFEGSVLCVLYQLMAIVAVYVLFKDRIPPDPGAATEEQAGGYYYEDTTG